MSFDNTTTTIRQTFCTVFSDVDRWFDENQPVRTFCPALGGWSIDQVLEHISLTNHFLMLTARKHVAIAERRAARGDAIETTTVDLAKIEIIGQRGSFGWERPEYMEPTGKPTRTIRDLLFQQLGECLIMLDRIKNGEGTLCRITMTVNNLGKIDLFQWLYFIVQHARRHLHQMEAIKREFAHTDNGSR